MVSEFVLIIFHPFATSGIEKLQITHCLKEISLPAVHALYVAVAGQLVMEPSVAASAVHQTARYSNYLLNYLLRSKDENALKGGHRWLPPHVVNEVDQS